MTEGFRKAALKLHGLAVADRDWMLQHMQPHERARLKELLRELEQLGISRGHRVSEDVSAEEARQALLSACTEPAGIAEALDALCAARPAEISVLLSAESDQVAAAFLSVHPWPWRARVLAEYGTEKRQRLSRALLQPPRLTPRLRAELIKVAAGRLDVLRDDGMQLIEAAVSRPASGPAVCRPTSFWQGLRRWLP